MKKAVLPHMKLEILESRQLLNANGSDDDSKTQCETSEEIIANEESFFRTVIIRPLTLSSENLDRLLSQLPSLFGIITYINLKDTLDSRTRTPFTDFNFLTAVSYFEIKYTLNPFPFISKDELISNPSDAIGHMVLAGLNASFTGAMLFFVEASIKGGFNSLRGELDW